MAVKPIACAEPAAGQWWIGSLTLAAALALSCIFATPAPAQSDDAETDNVLLEGSYSDVQFLAGRSVRITAEVTDDVFAAGRDVTLEGGSARNFIVAGFDVELRSGLVADMIAAGANVTISGAIDDDLVAAGRNIRISSSAEIGGDVRAAAETIELEGRVDGGLRAAARRVTISGEVAGKVDLLAERIVIASGATINGDLIYRSDAEPEIGEGATIAGEIRRIEVPMEDLRTIGLAIVGIGIAIALAWLIATLLVVVVVQLAFPAYMDASATDLRGRPWSSLGRGIVIFIVGAVLAGVLVGSILGVPLGLPVFLAIGLMLLFGYIAVAYCIGLFIRNWRKASGAAPVGTGGRIGWALLGAVILGVVMIIPFIGGILVGLAVMAGFGAATTELWRRLRTA